jgi:hypothetical protein
MQPNPTNPNQDNDPLHQVEEGMRVFDSQGDEIGRVERIRFGEVGLEDADRGQGPVILTTARMSGDEPMIEDFAMGGAGYIEDANEVELIRARMLQSGYIKIDTKGLFSSDRYALTEQIDHVSQDGVHLKVNKDELPRQS